MDLNTVKDNFDRVAKRQKLSYGKVQDVIDSVRKEIEIVLNKLQSTSDISDIDQKGIIIDLNAKLNEIGPASQLATSQKELNNALSRYGKVIDKHFHPDIAKVYRDVKFEKHTVDMIIAMHFYRQGLFELGDVFANEANITDADSLKAPFVEMHEILEQMKGKNLQPALAWANKHSAKLLQKGSALEFKLHGLHYVQILQNKSQKEALEYARRSFTPFAGLHMEELQKLMGCLIWAGRLDKSPYSELLADSHWYALSLELAQEFCSLLGKSYKSPLQVTISAGCQALPSLLKLASLMANKIQEWQNVKQLPLEIELDKEYQFHSIFACPVSREQSTEDNPPMLLPCGHVLCKQSIFKLSKSNSRAFKCPYCPSEASAENCKQLYF